MIALWAVLNLIQVIVFWFMFGTQLQSHDGWLIQLGWISVLFVALSVASRSAVIIGLLYALVWETILGGYVPGVKNASIRQWALAAGEQVLGSERATSLKLASQVSLEAGLGLLAAAIVIGAVIAVRRLQTIRLTTGQ